MLRAPATRSLLRLILRRTTGAFVTAAWRGVLVALAIEPSKAGFSIAATSRGAAGAGGLEWRCSLDTPMRISSPPNAAAVATRQQGQTRPPGVTSRLAAI